MSFEFCLNPLSLPVVDKDTAIHFLDEIFIGIASLCNESNTVLLYSNEDLNNTLLSPEFTYYDYKIALPERQNRDLVEFIYRLDERSPFLDFASDSEFNEMVKYDIYMFEMPPVKISEYDILKFACFKDAILMSLPTHAMWEKETISVKVKDTEAGVQEYHDIFNLYNCNISHLMVEPDWKVGLINICFSDDFNTWFSDLDEKNQAHVRSLIGRAYSLGFKGTIEQTKKIKESKSIWEWRGGRSYFGKGRIRILYTSISDKIFILYGFIKHDNNYTAEIRIAEKILGAL